jgi:hypothetical protein
MTGMPTNFSFPSRRRLFRYLGETDAMVELTELATRSFTASAEQSGDVSAFVGGQSQQYGICVNLAELDLSLAPPEQKLHRHGVSVGGALLP